MNIKWIGRLAAFGVTFGLLGGAVIMDEDRESVQDMVVRPFVDDGRKLTGAERRAADDCVDPEWYKKRHEGYPAPFYLVKPAGGGDPFRLSFEAAWERAQDGKVSVHLACEERR